MADAGRGRRATAPAAPSYPSTRPSRARRCSGWSPTPWNGRAAVASPQVTLAVLTTGSCAPRIAAGRPGGDDRRPLPGRPAGPLEVGRPDGRRPAAEHVQRAVRSPRSPRSAPRRVNVVGFDLWELGKTRTYEFPFYDRALADLVALAQDGAVLTASWHAAEPAHRRRATTTAPGTTSARCCATPPRPPAFWADYDDQLGVLAELQAAGVAVVFRPVPRGQRRLVLVGPAAGVDVQEGVGRDAAARLGRRRPQRRVGLLVRRRAPAAASPPRRSCSRRRSTWPASTATGPRPAATAARRPRCSRVRRRRQAGPADGDHRDRPLAPTRGTWKPSLVTSTARAQGRKPVWSLLWVDDAAGRKQISSLDGGLAWLDSCPNGLCVLG